MLLLLFCLVELVQKASKDDSRDFLFYLAVANYRLKVSHFLSHCRWLYVHCYFCRFLFYINTFMLLFIFSNLAFTIITSVKIRQCTDLRMFSVFVCINLFFFFVFLSICSFPGIWKSPEVHPDSSKERAGEQAGSGDGETHRQGFKER